MTKNKKNIADFQKALQSKAQFIVPDPEAKQEISIPANEDIAEPALPEPILDEPITAAVETEELQPILTEEVSKSAEAGLLIDEEILNKLKLLAVNSGRNYEDLVRHALTHFLMLKGLRLRDALMDLYQKEISLKDL